MPFQETTATLKIKKLSKRIRAVQGGTSASKTISILLYLIARAQTDEEPTLTSIVAESVPHLKRGAMRDFKKILTEHNYWRQDNWNATDSIYTFETGSQIEFFSSDNGDKLRGARRDRLFINECNNVPQEAFEQLEVRTKEFVFLDWNPTNEFWFYTEVQGKRDDVEHIILTYKDNQALDEAIVKAIENRKQNKRWWRVYGEGLLGEIEGRIYTGWVILDEVPKAARLVRRGLDFGYTNDPSALIDVYKYEGGYLLDELLYRKGMSNKQIADVINIQEHDTLTIGDSSEPKSIDEIKSYGVSIIGSTKGPGSVNQGIQLVQDQKIFVTKRSTNLIKEYRNYLWRTDKLGKTINTPEDLFNHCFSGDTLVYTTRGRIPIKDLVGKEGFVYTRGGGLERFYNVRATRTNAEVVTVHFTDGSSITVTPDHLLLGVSGEWYQAQLLQNGYLIQCAMYEGRKTIRLCSVIQRVSLYKVQGREVLQRIRRRCAEVLASLCVGVPQWTNSRKTPYPSLGSRPRQQPDRELGLHTNVETPKKPLDNREARTGSEECREVRSPGSTQVAWIKRGNRVAQATWEESDGETRTRRERLCTLSQKVLHNLIVCTRSFLSPELQNEGKTKTVERITRGFRAVTFNMEVEKTHCFVANGIIAHNSLDAARYAISSMLTKKNKKTTVTFHGY